MGFPSGYTELLIPKLLLSTLSLLDLLRSLILTLLWALGMSDFVEPDVDWAEPETPSTGSRSVSATLIREMLPVSSYQDISGSGRPESCAVCLYEFESGEEIRRLRNCPHMFHRSCVDRWIDHDRKTCPLCRTNLVPDELQEVFNEKLWSASGISDFYSEYSPISNF